MLYVIQKLSPATGAISTASQPIVVDTPLDVMDALPTGCVFCRANPWREVSPVRTTPVDWYSKSTWYAKHPNGSIFRIDVIFSFIPGMG